MSAFHKTLALLVFILIGVLLRSKLKERSQISGIKVLILSIALPATIFVALLKIKLDPGLLFLPLMALIFNFVMMGASYLILNHTFLGTTPSAKRTLMMLLPSLAPGLSCFPFVAEYLGDETLAWAALADVGNKFFVLIFLYMVAMRWYLQLNNNASSNQPSRLKGLLLSLVREPVNLVIVSALVLLSFGLNLESLPAFMQNTAGRLSALMTPLVLMFIGVAVNVRRQDLRLIIPLLSWRAGFAFFLSAVALFLIPDLAPMAAILIVIFPQSAASFWPYAHMMAVEHLEEKKSPVQLPSATFDSELALMVLACSLPFSSTLILGICVSGTVFTQPIAALIAGGIFTLLALATGFSVRKKVKSTEIPKTTLPVEVKLEKA